MESNIFMLSLDNPNSREMKYYMFNRALFHLMIVLSVCAAASSASSPEGDLTEIAPTVLADRDGAENDTVPSGGAFTVNDTAKASDLASVVVVDDDNVTEKDVADDAGPVDEDAQVLDDSANETTPTRLPPAEAPFATMPRADLYAASLMTVLPAVEDLYVNLTEEGIVYNDDHLVCEYLTGDQYREEEFPGMAMVQFDVSDHDIQEDDVAVLVLKAESIEKASDGMAGVVLVPITSEWSENSSATALALNILSAIFIMSNADDPDFSQIGVNFGDDEVLAFDVSENLKAAEGGRISFLLVAVSDADYKVSFKSRETGEGPSLLVAPYPSAPPA